MEQNVDEIAQSYEIIDKKELDTTGIDDESNNNIITSAAEQKASAEDEEEATQSSSPDESTEKSNDDNNNQAGNRKYTRDELIKLKQATANALPELKDAVKNSIFKEATALDRVLDRTRPQRDAVDKMMPSYANMPNTRNSYQKQRSHDHPSGRRSLHKNPSQVMDPINISLNQDVKLNESKNAWKPQMLVNEQDLPDDEKKIVELIKQFRSILNKITPENFPTLIEQLKNVKIDTVDLLDSCISLVFEKAIMEPSYGASYAQLCKEVSDVFVVPLDENNSQQKAVFKKRLITQCQKEFEKHRDNELIKNTAERLKEIEAEEDPTKKDELKADFEMENYKIRRRAVGTVHFIGELYKIEMLTSRIMQSCVSHLLDPSMCSEETLECLCKLLTTIGKRLEKLDAKKIDLTESFNTLAKIADKKNPSGVSSRIRFMIQDLIELRLNHWTPRKLQRENKPLTMDEIKKQATMEQYINKMENKDVRDNDRGGQNNRSGFYQGGGSGNNKRGNVVNEDGWSTQYTKSRPVKFDMNKIQLKTQSEEITLGGVPSFQNFTNRFSGLKEEENASTDQMNRGSYNGRFSGGQGMNQTPNRGNNSFGGNNRGNRGNNNGNNSNNRSAGSRSLQPPMSNNRQNNQQQNQQQSFGPSRKLSQQQMPITRAGDLPMKPNMMNRKISAPARTMTEGFNRNQDRNLITDVDQVSDAMKKMLKDYQKESATLNEVVDKLSLYRIDKAALVTIYNWIFDQHDKERFLMTSIICECVSRGIIMTADLLAALQDTIELAQDLACDLPKIYCYLGQLLALPLLKRIVHLKDLLTMSKLEIEANNGATVLKNVFQVFEQKFEKEGLCQLYNEAGVDFQEFLDSDTQFTEFLKENVSVELNLKNVRNFHGIFTSLFHRTLNTS
jgi:translation initiation factor 4G